MSAWLARRYVQPLFQVAQEKGELERVEANLADLDQTLTASADLRRFIADPTVERTAKFALVQKLFGEFSPYMLNFMRLAINKNRTSIFSVAHRVFNHLLNQHRGVIAGTVESAVLLNDEAFASIKQALETKFHSRLVLDRKVDPGLIGGLRVRVGNSLIDGSVKGQLRRLKQALSSA